MRRSPTASPGRTRRRSSWRRSRARDSTAVALLAPDGDGWSPDGRARRRRARHRAPADGERYDLRRRPRARDDRAPAPGGRRAASGRRCPRTSRRRRAMHRLEAKPPRPKPVACRRPAHALLAAVSHDLRTPLASIKALRAVAGARRRLVARRHPRVHAHHRRGSRSAPQAGREPARHEPLAGGRARLASTAGRARRDRAGRAREPEQGRATVRRRRARDPAARRRRPGAPRTSGRERRRQRGAALGPTDVRSGSRPRRWPIGSTCASSTGAAGSRSRSASACSSRSSAWATPRATPVSGSGSRSRRDSSTRSAASSPSRTHPVAASRW